MLDMLIILLSIHPAPVLCNAMCPSVLVPAPFMHSRKLPCVLAPGCRVMASAKLRRSSLDGLRVGVLRNKYGYGASEVRNRSFVKGCY